MENLHFLIREIVYSAYSGDGGRKARGLKFGWSKSHSWHIFYWQTLNVSTFELSRAQENVSNTRAWRFPFVLLADRSAAHRGVVCGSQTQKTAAEAWEYMRLKRRLKGLHVGGWWVFEKLCGSLQVLMLNFMISGMYLHPQSTRRPIRFYSYRKYRPWSSKSTPDT